MSLRSTSTSKSKATLARAMASTPTAPRFQARTFSSTGINILKRKSKLANGKRRSVWNSLLQTLPCILIERSLPTGAITPDRQIGAQLWGKPFTNVWPEQKDLLTYYAGIFNGNGRNTSINDNNNFMYVGRLELQPFKGKIFGQDSSLKLGADVLNSRDAAGTNISQGLNLLVNDDGSLSPFVLSTPAERTAWSVDAWFKLGPFDLIGEYLQEKVNGLTFNGVPGIPDFTTNGYYITAAYFLIPKKLQLAVRWEYLNPGTKGQRRHLVPSPVVSTTTSTATISS